MASLLGKSRIIDYPCHHGSTLQHGREDKSKTEVQNLLIAPRGIGYQMVQRLVHPSHVVRRQASGHRLDALALTGQQQTRAAILEGNPSVSMPRGFGPWLFPSEESPTGHQRTLKTVWHATLRRAKAPYFRIYDLRSTYATRLSASGVADEWVTQLLRQGDAKVFKKDSQMKLQMKREALRKLNREGAVSDGVLIRF